jgi:hypothetical protein
MVWPAFLAACGTCTLLINCEAQNLFFSCMFCKECKTIHVGEEKNITLYKQVYVEFEHWSFTFIQAKDYANNGKTRGIGE